VKFENPKHLTPDLMKHEDAMFQWVKHPDFRGKGISLFSNLHQILSKLATKIVRRAYF
jgi:hypothetical protein